MAVRTIDVLRAARKLVAEPETWCQHAEARDSSGHDVEEDSGHAVRWCASGAIRKICHEMTGHYRPVGWKSLDSALDELTNRRFGDDGLRIRILEEANDILGRLAALSVLDDAIAELEAQ
jgi:hypothetical protein